MRRPAFIEGQVTFALKPVETGVSVTECCRKMGISEQTFYRWKKKDGGLGLRYQPTLELEKAPLKKRTSEITGVRFRYGYKRITTLATDLRTDPTMIEMPSDTTFDRLGTGMYHSLAIDRDGDAWAWGNGGNGRLGYGGSEHQDSPRSVAMP